MCFSSTGQLLHARLWANHITCVRVLTINLGRYYNYHPHLTNEETIGKDGAASFIQQVFIDCH